MSWRDEMQCFRLGGEQTEKSYSVQQTIANEDTTIAAA
jgi:hypothetical protein